MKPLYANQKGYLVAWVLILLAVLSIVTLASLTLVANHTLMSTHFESSVKGFHYAEGGIHHYLAYINSGDDLPMEPSFIGSAVAYEDGFYRIEIVEDADIGSNEVRIRSTGWSETVEGREDGKRSIEVLIRKRSFTEYVYFSDNDGSGIWWATGEDCFGPYHTNSTLRVRGRPAFYGPVSYVEQICYFNAECRSEHTGPVGSNDPEFYQGIERIEPIVIPASNNQLFIRAQQNGYVFDGRTSIRLNANGTITVRNRHINNGFAQTMNLPPNGVIYINGQTPAGTGHGVKFNIEAGNAFVSGTLNGRLTIAAHHDIYITAKDPTQFIPAGIPAGAARQNYYNNITTTGGIKYAGTQFSGIYDGTKLVGYEANGDDMLGLVANRNIMILSHGWFLEPLGNDPNISSHPTGNVTIHGAIFAINESFANENINLPSPGRTIILRGSLIQNTRGGVGTITWGGQIRGFNKDYAHDNRMLNDAPPYFLEPEESGWEIRGWEEGS